MMEHGRRVQQDLEQQYRQRRRAEQQDGSRLDRDRQQDFDGMEPRAGRGIDIEIGMVHPVQAPEQANLMEGNMLTIDQQVKGEETEQQRQPLRKRHQLEKSASTLPGPKFK